MSEPNKNEVKPVTQPETAFQSLRKTVTAWVDSVERSSKNGLHLRHNSQTRHEETSSGEIVLTLSVTIGHEK